MIKDITADCLTKRGLFDNQINNYLSIYKETGIPIEVSFREIAPELNKPERLTHLIHTYPAKLLMHIPYFFLNNNVFSKEGDVILDSFGGSGTVMLEAIAANRNAISADSNPLARLIAQVKVFPYDISVLTQLKDDLLKNLTTSPPSPLIKQHIPNVNFWFLPEIKEQLFSIYDAINGIQNIDYRNFFLVCFSNCVKKVSLADPRVSVPVRLNPSRYKENHPLYKEAIKKLELLHSLQIAEKFEEIVDDNIERFKVFNNKITTKYFAKVISDDARHLTADLSDEIMLPEESVSLVLSSPPYAGAQKYIRSSSLSLGWLGFIKDNQSLSELDRKNIGRENYKSTDYKIFKETGIPQADDLLRKIFLSNPLRAHIAGNYLREMHDAFKEAFRVLKKDGYIILVVGNNQVCGYEFETQEFLRIILEGLGMKTVLRLIDDIRSYGLMTKRNKTANVISREWILVLQK